MAYFKSLDTSSYNVTTNKGRYVMFSGSGIKEITDPDEIRFFEGNTIFVRCDADGNLEGDNNFVAFLPKNPKVQAPAKPKSKKVAKKEPKKDTPEKEGAISKLIKKVTGKKTKKTKKTKKDNKDTEK